jgi:hypothetical protein
VQDTTTYVGMDVHKESIFVARLRPDKVDTRKLPIDFLVRGGSRASRCCSQVTNLYIILTWHDDR